MEMEGIVQKNRDFFNKIAKVYEISLFKNINAKMQKKVVQLTNIEYNSKILDAGCGTGILLEILYAEEKNLNLYGIDISEKMLKIAKKKLGNNANISLQSAEELNFGDKSFDYVFVIDAFHHYADQKTAINNFHRILKREGKLIIVDFSFGKLGNWLFHNIEPGNSGMHTVSELMNLFKNYKFKKIKQRKIGIFSTLTRGIK